MYMSFCCVGAVLKLEVVLVVVVGNEEGSRDESAAGVHMTWELEVV